jgi:hypothetical protein
VSFGSAAVGPIVAGLRPSPEQRKSRLNLLGPFEVSHGRETREFVDAHAQARHLLLLLG